MYIGVGCLNHRYAIPIKGWERTSTTILLQRVCRSPCFATFSVLFSRFTVFFLSLWFENEIYVPVFLLWMERNKERKNFSLFSISYECFHCTKQIRKFACTSLFALLCFALFLPSSLSASEMFHRSHSSPSASAFPTPSPSLSPSATLQCICLFWAKKSTGTQTNIKYLNYIQIEAWDLALYISLLAFLLFLCDALCSTLNLMHVNACLCRSLFMCVASVCVSAFVCAHRQLPVVKLKFTFVPMPLPLLAFHRTASQSPYVLVLSLHKVTHVKLFQNDFHRLSWLDNMLCI